MRTQLGADSTQRSGGATLPGLVSGKLAPTLLVQPTLLRPRLVAQLTEAVQRAPLTLISGPAGAGKTALAASWRNAQPGNRHVGWLTLDDYDDDPATFWSYVVQALGGAEADLADLVRPVPGEPLPASFVTQLASALLARPRPTVLVIDNADHLTNRQITGTLDLLIRNVGERLRFVLCARSDPQLPLHSYRLATALAEIGAADLAFTAGETSDLLSAAGVTATPEVAATLCERTEGWAVGLRLAIAPLQHGMAPDEVMTSLLEDGGSVAQYLFEEVLRDQPAGVRRFLLRVSVTDDLWPELVQQLGGRANGRRILAGLAHANAFVEQSPAAPGGYRIHPLFRELLRARLAEDHPSEVARLHRVCAAWYAEAGMELVAVDHAVAARDWTFATHLLVEDLLVGRVLAHRSSSQVRGITALPAHLTDPDVTVVRAATAISLGKLPTISDLVAAGRAATDSANGMALRTSAAVVSVAGSALRGTPGLPPGITVTADDLVAALPEDRQTERRELTAVLSTARFQRALASDEPPSALLADLGAAAVAANAAGSRSLRVRPLAYLALLEALGGRLHRAERVARDAAAGWADESRSETGTSPVVAVARAWVYLERYELEDARRWADRAQDQLSDAPDVRYVAPLAAVIQSCLLRVRREYTKAAALVQPYLDDVDLPRWVREEVVTEAVRTLMARGAGHEVTALLDGADDGTGWGARWRVTAALLDHSAVDPASLAALSSTDVSPVVAVETGILRACRHLEDGAVTTAVGELANALDVAAPETLRRPFLDAPLQARRLLRTHPDLRERGEWLSLTSSPVGRSPATSPPARTEPSTVVVQALSEREREVLVHLSEMLSTTEIAATMFISVNTVRTHIRSILRKLSATRRNQAVRRARDLGLI